MRKVFFLGKKMELLFPKEFERKRNMVKGLEFKTGSSIFFGII